VPGEHETGDDVPQRSGPRRRPAASPADKAAKGDASKSAAPKTVRSRSRLSQAPAGSGKGAKESEQKSAEAQRKEDNCRNARERVAQYEIGGRMTRINPQGERYYLEDAQIEQEKARARADVALMCN